MPEVTIILNLEAKSDVESWGADFYRITGAKGEFLTPALSYDFYGDAMLWYFNARLKIAGYDREAAWGVYISWNPPA